MGFREPVVHAKVNRIDMRFLILKYLLKKFCEKDLDQWERWKVNTKYGPVYIEVTRNPVFFDGYEEI